MTLLIFFRFYKLCEFLFMGICATPLGSGGGRMCLSAGGSPWGSTTLRLLLRETPLGSFFSLVVEWRLELCSFLSSHFSRSRCSRRFAI